MDANAILAILLSWSAHLSGYPVPDELPELQFRDHQFFVDSACGGNECNAVGWYNDQGVVYIDERYSNIEHGFASSLVVHELTHYLQHLSGKFDSLSCEDSIEREREAYDVQSRYAIQNLGTITMKRGGQVVCAYD